MDSSDIGYSIEVRPTLGDDLFEQDLYHNIYHQQIEDEDLHIMCTDAVTQSLTNSKIHSGGEFRFDFGVLVADKFIDEDINKTGLPDINSSQSSCQHSSCGSDSIVFSHVQLGGGETDLLMSDSSKSPSGSLRYTNSSEDGTNTKRSSNKSCDDGRRTYSLGNSNSKNAVAARDNRQKKKKYIENLEESVKKLCAENEYLMGQSNKQKGAVIGLQNEISYLRSVIANQSLISEVLTNVVKTPGIKLSTSFNNTAINNNFKKRNSTSDCCDVSDYSEEYSDDSSTARANSVSEPNYNSASLNSEQNVQGKKVQIHDKIKLRCDQAKKKHGTIDIENLGDSEISSAQYCRDDDISDGICLHVAGQNVSLELCSHCNTNVRLGIMSDHSYVKQYSYFDS